MISSRKWLDLADEDKFSRPTKRTRPRTKERPDYSTAPIARVLTVDRGRYRCDLAGTQITTAKARHLGRKGVIVGDLVRVVGDLSGKDGTLGRIVEVISRKTELRRTADDKDPYERPIVANADQLLIVTALADPPPRVGMIDRLLVAAYDAGIDPVLCLTKADLASPQKLIDAYLPLEVPMVVSQPESNLSDIKKILCNRTTVLVGHSGVGKSTLVNRLDPSFQRTTGEVNENTGKGRHTSTSAIALELPFGGWVIDTPGIRSFGLRHVSLATILEAFPDLEKFTNNCPRGCNHDSNAVDCGLDLAAKENKISMSRLISYRRIIEVIA